MTTIGDRIREIYAAAIKDHGDTIEYVRDYYADKDSRITRDDAQRLIWLYCGVTA
jgi:hypothetical protein